MIFRHARKISAVALLALSFIAGWVLTPRPPAPLRGKQAQTQSLDKILPQVRISDESLGAALDNLRAISKSNIIVDWQSFRRRDPGDHDRQLEEGPTRHIPAEIDLKDVTLRQALRATLAAAASSLDINTIGGMVFLSSDPTRRNVSEVMRCYDVSDLIERPGFWCGRWAASPPRFDRQFVYNPPMDGPRGIRAAVTIGSGMPPPLPAEVVHGHPADMLAHVIDTMLTNDEIEPIGHILVVTTPTESEQRQVAGLLDMIREIDNSPKSAP